MRDGYGRETHSCGMGLLLQGDTRMYGRKSTKNETSAKSLADQREVCFETAQDLGILVSDADWCEEVAGHGGDEPWSGFGGSGLLGDDHPIGRTRPVLTSIMLAILAGTCRALICYGIDRLFRSAKLTSLAIEIMARKGCLLVDRNGIVDISTVNGREKVLINAVNAETQRDHCRDASLRGVSKSRNKGKLVGPCNSLGFRSAGPKTGKVLFIEEEIAMVNRIFRLFYLGENGNGPLSIDEICRLLMEEGYIWTPDLHDKRAIHRTEQTRARIYDAQVRKLLIDVRLIGKQRNAKQVWDCDAFRCNGDTLVPLELFHHVREKLAEQARGSRSSINTYALKSRVRCGTCAQALTAQKVWVKDADGNRFYRTYWMTRANRGQHWCRHQVRSIRHDILDEFIDDHLAPLLLAEMRERGLDDQNAVIEQEQARLKRELAEAENHYRVELPKYHRTKIDAEIFESMQEDAKREIERLRGELRLVLLRVTKLNDVAHVLQDIRSAPPAARRDAIRATIRWVAVISSEQGLREEKKPPKRNGDYLGSLVFLTAWSTCLTARMSRASEKPGHRNTTVLSLATASQSIGGVDAFLDPGQFYRGLEQAYVGHSYDFNPRDVMPGYTPHLAPKIATFEVGWTEGAGG